MGWFLLSTILMAFAGLLSYLYFWRSGQFDELEDVKYQMFRQEEEEKQEETTECQSSETP